MIAAIKSLYNHDVMWNYADSSFAHGMDRFKPSIHDVRIFNAFRHYSDHLHQTLCSDFLRRDTL